MQYLTTVRIPAVKRQQTVLKKVAAAMERNRKMPSKLEKDLAYFQMFSLSDPHPKVTESEEDIGTPRLTEGF